MAIEREYMNNETKQILNNNPWTMIIMGISTIFIVLQHYGRESSIVLDLFYHIDVLAFFYIAGYKYSITGKNDITKRKVFITRTKKHLKYYFGISLFLLLIYVVIWLTDKSFSFHRLVNAAWGILYARAGVYYPYFNNPNQIYPLQVSNGALWFIPAMIIGEGLLLIYLKAKESKRSNIDLLVILGLIVCGVALKGLGILLPWSIDTAPYIALIMIAGYEIAPVNLIHNGRIGKTTITVIIIALALYVFMVIADPGYNLSIREYGYFNYNLVFSLLCGILGCIILSEACKVMARSRWFTILAWIGKNCLGIIGLHYLIIDIVPRMIGKTTAEISLLETIGLLIGMIVILGGVSGIISKLFARKADGQHTSFAK